MERALKERVIGAVVLVIFVVLVVPIFLDGPPQDDGVVTERVLLPGQDAEETKTVVLDRERSVPIPAASDAESDPVESGQTETAPQPRPIAAAREPVESEPPAAAAAADDEPQSETVDSAPQNDVSPPETASSTGMWAVQLGSFSSKDNAERLADQLRRQGYAAFVSQVATPSGTMHRVRIGPQKDRQSAVEMAARLDRAGHQGRPVPHP